jgi:asparagine synthase (glutamine-hydrolysing)
MCGIAGVVSLTSRRPDPQRISGMVATLRHRGPDDRATFLDGPAALGAARLSVIDVAGGRQPITIEGGITVAQNGEIYNYIELRDELQSAGRAFTTACDTEVIAHLYAVHGVAGFAKMRGMFAIAIWDAPRQRLVLARDRAGKKPLYYLRNSDDLLFASEPKAILAALDRVPSANAEALLSFFTFGYVAGEQAVFEGMRRLPPGASLTLDVRAGQTRGETIVPFWRWPSAAETDDLPVTEAVERIRAELTEAVRIRLRSDVPLGAFLSGGMDSAAILALMTRQSSRPVKTFTIGFGVADYDELTEARATAQHFGADHHEQVVRPDCVTVAERLAYYYDEPFADASAIPTFYVAELARRHVTVCLTGDGGDELFAGYTPYSDALARVRPAPVAAFRRSAQAHAVFRCTPAARDGFRR